MSTDPNSVVRGHSEPFEVAQLGGGGGGELLLSARRLDGQTHGTCRSLLSLFGGFCAALSAGAIYGWGVIAAKVSAYGYDVDDQLVMGTICALSVYVTLHLGIFFDTCGARASLALGGLLLVAGWLLASWGIQDGHPAWLVGIYLALVGQATTPVMSAALESVSNFSPERKGLCSSAVLTGFGLTSLLMAQLSKNVFPNPDDLPGFLLTLATACAVLIAFQLLVFAPPAVVSTGSVVSGRVHLKTMIRNRNTWLFFFVLTCFGMELFYFSVNIASINALSSDHWQVHDIITIFAVCNVGARPVVGLLSDLLPLSRAQMLAIGSLLCAVGMVFLAIKMMLPAAILAGLSDGFMMAVWLPLAREMHGNANWGVTFSVYLLALGIGDVIINFIVGMIFKHILSIWTGPAPGIVCCVLMVLSVLTALVLHWRLARSGRDKSMAMP